MNDAVASRVLVLPIASLAGVDLAPLREDAQRAGVTFVERLAREWHSGANRFDAAGEVLFGAFEGERLVGCGGLNVDPYASDPSLGRVRHVYVLSSHRRRHVGTALLDAIFAHASRHFRRLRLKTETSEAVRFYESLGFAARTIDGGFEMTRSL